MCSAGWGCASSTVAPRAGSSPRPVRARDTGMRERVAMLDGEMTAGATEDGGYEVAVFLPAPAAETATTKGGGGMERRHPGPARRRPGVGPRGLSVLLGAMPASRSSARPSTAGGGLAGRRPAARRRPDGHPDARLNGLEATREIVDRRRGRQGARPDHFDLDEYVYQALRAGASGFLLKDASVGQFAEGVRIVAAGEALLAPTVTKRLITSSPSWAPRSPPPSASKTSRSGRRRCWYWSPRACPTARSPTPLVVAESTVKTHVAASW